MSKQKLLVWDPVQKRWVPQRRGSTVGGVGGGYAEIIIDTTSLICESNEPLVIQATSPIQVSGDATTDTLTISLRQGSGSGLDADTVDGKHASDFAPASHDHDSRYAPLSHSHPEATTTSSGFMSAADKAKLDGIASGAEPNQDAFAAVRVGTQTILADAEQDILELAAGANIALTADPVQDKVTIAVTQGPGSQLDADTLDGQHASSFAAATHDHDGRYALLSHTHPDATTTASGFMSAADKTKLDSIQAGAEVNQNAFSVVRVGTTDIAADEKEDVLEIRAGAGITLTPDEVNDRLTVAVNQGPGSGLDADTVDGQHASAFAPAAHNHDGVYAPVSHTHPNATTTTAGFMSAADKDKLDSLDYGFETVKVGATLIEADQNNRTLELVAGSNITLTPDATNRKVTIAATGGGGGGGGGGYSHIWAGSSSTELVADSGEPLLIQGQSPVVVSGSSGTTHDTVTIGIEQGPGSGLDADTVDGQHASAFATDVFSIVKVGTTNVHATGANDTLELKAGYGTTLSADASAKSVTIGLSPTWYQVTNTSAVTINSTSPITITSVSVEAGTYMIIASCTFRANSSSSATLTMYLRHESTDLAAVSAGSWGSGNGPVTLVAPTVATFSSSVTLNIAATTSNTSYAFTAQANTGRILALRIS